MVEARARRLSATALSHNSGLGDIGSLLRHSANVPLKYGRVSNAKERPLSPTERGVLKTILGTAFPGVEELRRQVPNLVVSGMCGCGCPTVYFGRSEKVRGVQVVGEAAVAGTHDSVLLFTSESGVLKSMEYVWLGEVPPDVFPASAQLVVAERS